MRGFTSAVILFAAGCGQSTSSVPTESQQSAPLAFDPNDGERSARWLAQVRAASEKATIQGNEISKKKEAESLAAELAKLKGTVVKWRVRVREIRQDGQIVIKPIEVVEDGSMSEGQRLRWHHVILPAEVSKEATAAPMFSAKLGSTGWIAALRPDDTLTLSGTVDAVEISKAASWPEGDVAHNSLPFLVWLRSPILARE